MVVQLRLAIDDAVCKKLVCLLTHAERLVKVFAHLLLLKFSLPIFDIRLLFRNLLQVLVHLLVLSQGNVALICLLFSLELARFHVFKFNLAGDEGLALSAEIILIVQIEDSF